jgi:ABC-2 type transport system ATP-binding protein
MAASAMATPAIDAEPAFRLVNVRRAFHAGRRSVVALDGVSATGARGLVTGVIGPDGAGKTTLLRLIAGLLRPDGGRIEVLGLDVAARPLEVQSRLGYMPQRFGLYEELSVRQNLDLYADLQGLPPERRAARYAELLHMTGLGPFSSRLAGRLSGGMKQKLGLACTLLRPPELLLLDEPTVGVDPISRRELWEIILHLARAAGATVLFSTAYLDEAERCDAILLIHEGRLLGAGPPSRFTEEMAGRSFLAGAASIGRRRLERLMAEAPCVIDAAISGSRVRLVIDGKVPPVAEQIAPEVPDLRITHVAPRLEDWFVARLKPGEVLRRSRPSPAPLARPGPHGDAIVVHELTKRFDRFLAVDRVSFGVARGEIFGLLGANGAGKSTTFRMLCGLLPPSAGTLRVAGFDLRTAAASARGRIGYMAQKFALYGDLSVRENLNFFSSAYRLAGARQRARIAWALDEFGLGPLEHAPARDLPLGFKQRLALAVALMHEPEILFLDEPTSGVDPLARREFWRRISALALSGVTVLVTTHFMEEAEYCDRLGIMAEGRLLAEGSPDAIKARVPATDRPEPSMEDAFIAVIEAGTRKRAA